VKGLTALLYRRFEMDFNLDRVGLDGRPQLAPRAGAVSFGIARHETASFARIILPNRLFCLTREASHGTLAKTISTKSPIQFHRELGHRRVDVGGSNRVRRDPPVCLRAGLGA
jgi:hypothetical protein